MQKTLIYIDTNTRSQVFADGSFVNQSKDYLNIERGQWQILCIQFVDRKVDDIGAVTVSEVSFPANTSFILVADNNFEDDDNLMLKSLQSVTEFDEADPLSNMFNIDGDWIDGTTADFSKGQLSIRINSDTVKYADVLGESEKLSSGVYLSVKQYMQGISNPSTIAWIPFIAINTIRDWSSAQVNPPTGTEAISFINAYFRNPLERQWSDDGEEWFDSQSIEHDEYYRERISNIGAEWSDKIRVARGGTFTPSVDSSGVLSWTNDIGLENPAPINIKGEKGDKGDMGDPGPANTLTIGTVTTGEAGTSASASITGEAPNQVLNLNIPKGDKGDPGDGGAGSGDMTKSVYDTNNDGKVDTADEADDALNVGGKTAAQVATAVDNSHTHSNKDTLDKLGESDGTLTFDGSPISGGGGTADSVAWDNVTGKPSTFPPADHTHEIANVNGLQSALDAKGTVKSVNGVEPDSSGDVTIETESSIDESRLLPEIAEQDIGKFLSVAGSQVQEGNDENTFLLLHFDGNANDSSDNALSDISAAGVSYVPGKFNQAAQFAGSTSSYVAIPNTSEFPFSGDFTISFWAKANSSDRFGLLFYESDFTFGIDTIDNVYSVWASSNGSSWDILQADSGYNAELTSDSGRGSIAITPGEWQHIAFVRSGNDWYLFVNGTMSLHKQRSRTVYNPQEQLRIGRHGNDSISAFSGLIDEFKIDTIARWTEDFTPPEHAYDAYIAEGIHTEFTDIGNKIDEKISAHNQNSSAHPDKLSLSGGTLTGELKSTAYNAFRMIQGEYGTFFRNDGRNLYILMTNAGDQNGSYNDFRPLSVNLSTGQCDISGKAVYDGSGNNIAETYVVKNHPTFTSGIEISGAVPYIDFHFNSDSSDYTSRIYETASGTLTVIAKLSVTGGIAPRYNAQTDLTSAYTSGGNSYTFTGGGWLYAVTSAGGSYAINGGTVVSAASGATASCCVPVNKGDTVTGSAAGTLIFYPY